MRDHVAAVAFGATVVGKMHTAGLKGEPLAEIPSETRKEWLETLDRAEEATNRQIAVGAEPVVNAEWQIGLKASFRVPRVSGAGSPSYP